MGKLSITQMDLPGRLILTRVDFNVPLTPGGAVADDSRITASLPTLRYLSERGARVVLCSHLGRPKGVAEMRYSLRPVAERLEHRIGRSVGFCPQLTGSLPREMTTRLERGGLLMLENLRFDPGEERNDPVFAEQLAQLGEAYVNDAFGVAHRAHASTVGVTRFFKQCAAGLLMEREIEFLSRLLAAREHPYLVLLGGAKASDKLPVVANLLGKADRLLIGGGMAYTFLRAQGQAVGASLVQEDFVAAAEEILQRAKPGQVLLPSDHVLDNLEVVREIPPGGKAMDIGPETRERFMAEVARARILFWNGPMGVFEKPPLDAGTLAIARAVAACAGVTVAGGGDSLAALKAAGVEDQLTHISTGGGASLEFLAGTTLPGVAVLTEVQA